MDEPFSAVDPVVRAELQQELLRVQEQLHKTIVFVTHDIDEAVKLGDRIAVMQVGGKLVQFDAPERVLAHPPTTFVESFLGMDRGIRWLSFFAARNLSLHAPAVLGPTASPADAKRARPPPTPTGCSWSMPTAARSAGSRWRPSTAPPAAIDLASLRPLGHTFAPAPTRCGPPSTPSCCPRRASPWPSTTTGALLGVASHEDVSEAIRAAGGRA